MSGDQHHVVKQHMERQVVEKFAGALGTTAGIVGTGGLALANAPRIGASAGRLVGKGLGYGSHYAPKAFSKGMEYAGRGYSKASDLGSRAMAQGRKIYAEGPSLARRAGAGIDRGRRAGGNAFNKGTTSLDRGTSTSYFGNLRNEFMGGLNEQSLLDQALRTGSSNIGTNFAMDSATRGALLRGRGESYIMNTVNAL